VLPTPLSHPNPSQELTWDDHLYSKLQMADAECPVCMNSYKIESMRSLHCGKSQDQTFVHDVSFSSSAGHTYCSSCVEQVIQTRVLKCPECRHNFEPKHVRRLYITPSTSNDKSAAQATPSDSAEEDGFIRQATHIASRLKKMDADTPAQSLKIAVEIMEHVATIQSKRAQVRSLHPNSCICPTQWL